MDSLPDLMRGPAPTARRPLLGVTVLIVEDSRFASEAVRMMCQRSGARIRRADSLENARRHLMVYRPTVALVDVGLPDGSGIGLIRALANASPRLEVILGTSGDATAGAEVMRAGANGFLEKPLDGLSQFQEAILRHLPPDRQPPAPRTVSDETIVPDQLALRDDLTHIARLLNGDASPDRLNYATQFLTGVAYSAHDVALGKAATEIARLRRTGHYPKGRIAALSDLVHDRLAKVQRI